MNWICGEYTQVNVVKKCHNRTRVMIWTQCPPFQSSNLAPPLVGNSQCLVKGPATFFSQTNILRWWWWRTKAMMIVECSNLWVCYQLMVKEALTHSAEFSTRLRKSLFLNSVDINIGHLHSISMQDHHLHFYLIFDWKWCLWRWKTTSSKKQPAFSWQS